MSSKRFLDDTSLSHLNDPSRTPQATSTVIEDRTRSWLDAQPPPMPLQDEASCSSSLGILSDTFSDDGLDTSLVSVDHSAGPMQRTTMGKQADAELRTLLQESKQRLAAVLSLASEQSSNVPNAEAKRSYVLGPSFTSAKNFREDIRLAKDESFDDPNSPFIHPLAKTSSLCLEECYADKGDVSCGTWGATQTVKTGSALASGPASWLSSREQFITADTSAAMLKKLGGKFQAFEEAAEASLEEQPSKQDITRPSWLPGEESRVSIRSYFKARSAPIQGLPMQSSDVAASLAAAPVATSPTTQSIDVMALQELGMGPSSGAQETVPEDSVRDPSVSFIYRVLEDISVSESPSTTSRKFIQATKARTKAEPARDSTFKQPLTAAPRSKKAAALKYTDVAEMPVQVASLEATQRLRPSSHPQSANRACLPVPTKPAMLICSLRSFSNESTQGAKPAAESGSVVLKEAASLSVQPYHNAGSSIGRSASSSGYYEHVTPSGSRRFGESQPRLAVIGGPLARPEVSLGRLCVGVPSPLVLTLVNLSAEAVTCTLSCSRSSLSTCATEDDAVRVVLPSPVTLASRCTAEVQGTLVSRRPGEVVAEVDVSEEFGLASQAVSDASLGPSCLLVRASMEVPRVRLEPHEGLHWDALPWDSGKSSRHFTISNCGSCLVPIRISICQGNGLFSLCTVGKEEEPCVESSTIRCTIADGVQATKFGVTCFPERAKVLTVEAKVEVTLDSTHVPELLLASMAISAVVLPPRLAVDGDENLVVTGGRKKTVRVVNRGSCCLEVGFRVTAPFSVTPARAVLEPSLGAPLQVSLADGAANCEGLLEAVLLPQGHAVDLATLWGVPTSLQCGPLEANMRMLLWPGTQVGCSTTKCVMFRNPNSFPMEVSFAVQKHSASQFELLMQGRGRLTRLLPGASLEVQVIFKPTSVGFAQSRLVISSHGPVSEDNKSVRLYGFGGELHLCLDGLHPLGPLQYLAHMGVLLEEGATAGLQFNLVNRGKWDCCVSLEAVAKQGACGLLAVTPQCLVLRCNECKVVSVSFKFEGSKLEPCSEIVVLGTLKILYGFEDLRQRAKQTLTDGLKKASSDVSSFLKTFEGERESTGGNICIAAGTVEDAVLRSTSQRVVTVTCGPRPGRLQDSVVAAASFAALEDTTFLN